MGNTRYSSADSRQRQGQSGPHDRQTELAIRRLVRTIDEHFGGAIQEDTIEIVYDELGLKGALGREYAGLHAELRRRAMEDRVHAGRPRQPSKKELSEADRELDRDFKQIQGIVKLALDGRVILRTGPKKPVRLELNYDSVLVRTILSLDVRTALVSSGAIG